MLQQIFGTQLDFPVRVAVALIVIAVLLGVTIMLLRRFSGGVRAVAARGRSGPRLALIDSISIDQRRKLMLVRCDEIEHLILVGGPTDIVVETDVADREAKRQPAPVVAAMPTAIPATAPASRAEASVREPAVTREAPAPRLAPAPAVDALPPAEPKRPTPELAAPAAAQPATQDTKRPQLARRPLLRSDGLLSGATRGIVSRTAPPPAPAAAATLNLAAPEETAAAPAPAVSTPAPEPVITPAPTATESEPPTRLATEAPREEIRDTQRKADSRIDEMAERLDAALDAALSEPAEDSPRLSLADLLDEDLAVAVSETAETVAEEPEAPAPRSTRPEPFARPVVKTVEPERAPEILSERSRPAPIEPATREPILREPTPREPLSTERFAPRPRDVRPVLSPSPTPQVERPDRLAPAARHEPPVRPELPPRTERPAAGDFPGRPREFTFRPSEGAVRTREAPRLEANRRPLGTEERMAPTPSISQPSADALALDVSPRDILKRDERRPSDMLSRSEPALSARRWESTSSADLRSRAAPVVAPPTAPVEEKAPAAPAHAAPLDDIDPLSDLDAEMANLLGRSSASGH